MGRVLVFFKWVVSTPQGISYLANISTIGAFALAIYAIVFPETLANYLDRVAEASEKTALQAERAADNLEEIVEAIPNWPNVGKLTISTKGVLSGEILNESNREFSDATVVIIDKQKAVSVDIGVVSPRSELRFSVRGITSVVRVCFFARDIDKDLRLTVFMKIAEFDIDSSGFFDVYELDVVEKRTKEGLRQSDCDWGE